MPPILSPSLNVMISAAQKAARSLRRDFGELENLQVSEKGPGDFVSNADLKAEEIIFDSLNHARPGYGFLMEEGGQVKGNDKTHRWIIDPLDGTTNFLHGIPHFSISIALEREGQLICGIVYNPISDELFYAEKGKGAFMNDRRLRVAGRNHLSQAVFACGDPHGTREGRDKFIPEIDSLLPKVSGLRRMASSALDLAWVAAGRFDGFLGKGFSPLGHRCWCCFNTRSWWYRN